MLTDLFVKNFRKTIKTGNVFSCPLIWDDKWDKLYVSSKHHANTVVIHVFFCFYSSFAFIQMINYRNRDLAMFNFFQLVFYSFVETSIGSCIYSCQSEDVAQCWNRLILYGRNFCGKNISYGCFCEDYEKIDWNFKLARLFCTRRQACPRTGLAHFPVGH